MRGVVDFEAVLAREIAETDRSMVVVVYGFCAVLLVLLAGLGYVVWRLW